MLENTTFPRKLKLCKLSPTHHLNFTHLPHVHLNHTTDNLRRKDEGLCQDSEEQVQIKAVLHEAPTERLPASAVSAGS